MTFKICSVVVVVIIVVAAIFNVNKSYTIHVETFTSKLYHVFEEHNPLSAGIDLRRQNLTSQVDPRTRRFKYFIMAVDP